MQSNEKQLSAHSFPDIYSDLGINLEKLGCVMLNIQPLKLPWLEFDKWKFYKSSKKECFWIDGYVGDKPHMTILYGLLEEAKNYKKHIDELLKDWEIDDVIVDRVGFFESPYPDDPYYCIVAHIKVTPKVLEGNQRLEMLPHINTFAGYKPHITIAYVEMDEKMRDKLIHALNMGLAGKSLKVVDSPDERIDLGGNK